MRSIARDTRAKVASRARALLALAVLATARVGSAQDVSVVADAHFATGVKAYDRKDFETALQEFKQSYKLSPSPSVLRNIGQCELRTRRPLEALVAFRAYASDPSVPKHKRQLAAASVAEAYQQTGHLSVVRESDARVRIDGVDAELVEGAYDVTAGSHEVQVTTRDRAGSKRVDALAGRITLVEVSLTKLAPPAPEVVAPVAVPPSTTTASPSLTADASPATGGSSTAKWVTVVSVGTVGVAGLVLGGVFAAKASAAQSDAETSFKGASCPSDPRCSAGAVRLSTYGTDHNAEVVSFIVGGALVATSVVLAFAWPKHSMAAAARFLPGPAMGPPSPLSFTF